MGAKQQIHHEQACQEQARHQGAQEEVSGADRQAVGHEHEHDAGWNENAQRADGGDGARGKIGAVALGEHGGQAKQREQHDARTDDSRGGRQQQSNNGDGEG